MCIAQATERTVRAERGRVSARAAAARATTMPTVTACNVVWGVSSMASGGGAAGGMQRVTDGGGGCFQTYVHI